MTEAISKYIIPMQSDNAIANTIINNMVYPTIRVFCEIPVHYETGTKKRTGVYAFTYGNWNSLFEPEIFFNGSDMPLYNTAITTIEDDILESSSSSESSSSDGVVSYYIIDYKNGTIAMTDAIFIQPGDNIQCSYNFSWFTTEMLESYVLRSLGTINYSGNGAVTSYTIDDLPEGFWGIAADLVVAMCMENLIMSYTMWAGKLIFAISPNGLYDGSDSVVSQLETIKRNSEERAYKALDNPQTRAPHSTSKPTDAYWRAVTQGSGVRVGPHGQVGYGKTRGIKYNRLVGFTGPDLGV